MAHTLRDVSELEVGFNHELVTEKMQKMGMDVQQLATAIGVEVKSVRRWLKGDLPKAAALARLAVLLSEAGSDVHVEVPRNAKQSLLIYKRPRKRPSGTPAVAAAAG